MNIALTQTINAYKGMPETPGDLGMHASKLGDIADANIAHHEELVRDAAKLDVKALCMGELFTGPYFALGELAMWTELAEDAQTGPTVRAMQALAQETGMVLVAPIYELDAKSGKRFNTAVVIESDGSILGKYRKTHIPAGTNDQGSFYETFYYERSDGKLSNGPANISDNPFFPVFNTTVGKIGVAICYDRHFPGVMKALADAGAELIFSPAVTFGQKSRRMWEVEFEVDAARHNVFIAGSNRKGSEAPWHQEYFGASHIVGPNGRAEPIESRPELVIASVDLASLAEPDPSGWNLPRDLRSEIY